MIELASLKILCAVIIGFCLIGIVFFAMEIWSDLT